VFTKVVDVIATRSKANTIHQMDGKVKVSTSVIRKSKPWSLWRVKQLNLNGAFICFSTVTKTQHGYSTLDSGIGWSRQ